MSILVTGFEPFGGSSSNASWEAVSLLPETIAGHAVYRMRLPVCYGQAGDLLVEMMRRIRRPSRSAAALRVDARPSRRS